ncbi:hypothetical protein V8E36_008432 [Tilletia maclaganii]
MHQYRSTGQGVLQSNPAGQSQTMVRALDDEDGDDPQDPWAAPRVDLTSMAPAALLVGSSRLRPAAAAPVGWTPPMTSAAESQAFPPQQQHQQSTSSALRSWFGLTWSSCKWGGDTGERGATGRPSSRWEATPPTSGKQRTYSTRCVIHTLARVRHPPPPTSQEQDRQQQQQSSQDTCPPRRISRGRQPHPSSSRSSVLRRILPRSPLQPIHMGSNDLRHHFPRLRPRPPLLRACFLLLGPQGSRRRECLQGQPGSCQYRRSHWRALRHVLCSRRERSFQTRARLRRSYHSSSVPRHRQASQEQHTHPAFSAGLGGSIGSTTPSGAA